MVLGARTREDRGEVLVLSSSDKRRWRHINTITTPEPFGYMWECPDLFQLDGQWFLLVSPQGIPCQNVYGCGFFALHGDFRGECTLGDYHPLDGGFDYYAPQSFADGERRLQFGWKALRAPYGPLLCKNRPCLCPKGERRGLLGPSLEFLRNLSRKRQEWAGIL